MLSHTAEVRCYARPSALAQTPPLSSQPVRPIAAAFSFARHAFCSHTVHSCSPCLSLPGTLRHSTITPGCSHEANSSGRCVDPRCHPSPPVGTQPDSTTPCVRDEEGTGRTAPPAQVIARAISSLKRTNGLYVPYSRSATILFLCRAVQIYICIRS